MYTDSTLRVLQDNQAFTHVDTGVKYPKNYPKNEIDGLFAVTLVTQPTGVVIDGYHIELIDVTYTQVWDTSALPTPPAKTWDDVDNLQNQLLSVNSSVMKRITRYKLQFDLTGKTPKENAAKYQELLQYTDDVRDADETNHATPQLAIDALNALTEPT